MDDLTQLRVELNEVRDLAEAALMAIVGEDKVRVYKTEAAVNDKIRRENRGTPLNNLFGGNLLDRLTWERHGIGAVTVEELVDRVSRKKFAALPGGGAARLQKVDAIVSESGLTWAEAS